MGLRLLENHSLYESQGFFDKSYSFPNGTISVGVLTNLICLCKFRTCVSVSGPTDAQVLCRFLGMVNRPETLTLLENAAKCETFPVQMSFICMISLWNRGLGQLGKGLLINKIPPTITRRNKERRGFTCDLNTVKFCSWRCQSPLICLLRIELYELDRSNRHVMLLRTW